MTVNFDDAAGGKVILSVTETTGYSFCKGTAIVGIEIEKSVPVVCNDHINVSIGEECVVNLTADMMLEGQPYPDDSYTIVVKDGFGNIVPQPLTSSSIGKTYQISIVHDCFGNSCWGLATIEDKLPPVIECPSADTVFCYEVPYLSSGTVNVQDCSPTTTAVSVSPLQGNECGDKTITRTYTVTDAGGYTATCDKTSM